MCNNHAETCHPLTGKCIELQCIENDCGDCYEGEEGCGCEGGDCKPGVDPSVVIDILVYCHHKPEMCEEKPADPNMPVCYHYCYYL